MLCTVLFMHRILVSIFLAAIVAGAFLWLPWQQVSADRAYLQAVVISSTAGSIEMAEPSEMRPEFYRKAYVPKKNEISSVEQEEISEKESSSAENLIEEDASVVPEQAPAARKRVTVPKLFKKEKEVVTKESPKISAAVDPLVAEILRLLNAERAGLGYEPLLLDTELSALAVAHSKDMATHSYLAHEDQGGCNLTCRVKNVDYKALAWAENIVYLENEYLLSTKEEASEMMDSWMQSGGHRKNIENGTYTHIGIGVARSGDRVYVTTDFALPKF